jgi:uncharacterized protein (UPF0335 family)
LSDKATGRVLRIGHAAFNNPGAGIADQGKELSMSDVGGVSGERLRSFIERIERLEDEKKALSEDIREVYSEAKGTGFDVKVLRQVIRLRKMDASDRSEMEEVLDVYKRALGM